MQSTTPKKSSAAIILEAVQDLHAQEQTVTREALAEITGLKLTVVDDRIATLVDDGLVHRVQRGVFVPALIHPPARPISKTMLPGGMVKLEIGDEILNLTPREDRALAALQAGTAIQLAHIETGHNAAILASELAAHVRRLEREVNALRAKNNPAQMGLLEQEG